MSIRRIKGVILSAITVLSPFCLSLIAHADDDLTLKGNFDQLAVNLSLPSLTDGEREAMQDVLALVDRYKDATADKAMASDNLRDQGDEQGSINVYTLYLPAPVNAWEDLKFTVNKYFAGVDRRYSDGSGYSIKCNFYPKDMLLSCRFVMMDKDRYSLELKFHPNGQLASITGLLKPDSPMPESAVYSKTWDEQGRFVEEKGGNAQRIFDLYRALRPRLDLVETQKSKDSTGSKPGTP